MRCELVGFGRMSWSAVLETLDGLDCAWADLDGWHMAPAPHAPPITTHLWGWSDERWARVRVDGTDGIVGRLSRSPTGNVEVQTRRAMGWGDNRGRIPATSQAWLDTEVTLLVVGGLTKVTFVHCGSWPGDGEAK